MDKRKGWDLLCPNEKLGRKLTIPHFGLKAINVWGLNLGKQTENSVNKLQDEDREPIYPEFANSEGKKCLACQRLFEIWRWGVGAECSFIYTMLPLTALV